MRAIALAVMLLAGCASAPVYPMLWARPDARSGDLEREAAQCRVQAKTVAASERDGIAALGLAKSVYHDCMIGKGWHPKPQ